MYIVFVYLSVLLLSVFLCYFFLSVSFYHSDFIWKKNPFSDLGAKHPIFLIANFILKVNKLKCLVFAQIKNNLQCLSQGANKFIRNI